MIRAQLANGSILEFPDGTSDDVINSKVREMMASEETEGAAGIARPEATPTPPQPAKSSDKGIMEGIVEQAPQTLGGIATGLAAGAADMGFWPVVGMVSLGAGAGEAYKQIGQHLSGSLDAPKTSIEAAQRIGKAALTEGGWEIVGGLVAKGFGKIMAPFKSGMIKKANEVIEHFDDMFKPILLPSEATESRVLDLIQNVSEASLIGGNSIAKFKTQRLKFFDDFADSLIDQFGQRTDPADLGNLFVTVLTRKQKVHAAASKVMYNSVKAGRVKIPTKSAKNFARPLQKRGAKLVGIEAKNAGDDLMEAIMGLPDNLSFKEAVELRSRLIARIDEFSILNKKAPAIGKAKKMVKIIDGSIEKSLKGAGKAAGPTPLKAGTKGVTFGVNHETIVDLPEIISKFEAGERRFYRGYHPKATGKKPIRKDFYPMAKRDLSSKRRATWMAKDKKSALTYGTKVEEIVAKPEAKILYEGTEEFGRVAGITNYNPRKALEHQVANIPGGDIAYFKKTRMLSLKDYQNIVQKAKDAGYDALSFAYDDMMGTVMFNEDAFIRTGGSIKKSLKGAGKVAGEGPSPLEAWRAANKFYKEGQQKFNNTLLRRLIKLADDTRTGSEMIAPAIFKPGRVNAVRRVKRVLDPGDWRKMQGFFMEHLLQKSTNVDGEIVGKRILNNISGKPNSFGMPMMKEMFSPHQIDSLMKFGKAVELAQKRQAEGAGKVLIQLSQAGAVGAVIKGTMELAATTILIGPAIVGKMMTRPYMCNYLTRGFTMPAKAPQAAGLLARIVAATERIERETHETKD